MVVIVKRRTVLLVSILFLLIVGLYGINMNRVESSTTPVSGESVPGTTDGVKRVIIDPGHGGEDPGAVSDYSGISEKNINLYIGLKVKELLEKDGVEVLMTRTEDRLEYSNTKSATSMRSQDLVRRKKMMDESNAAAVVSIHLNKFPQTKYHGAQVFFPKQPVESQKLAVSIQKSLKEVIEPGNSREALIKRDPLIILKNAKVPTVIVECGFLSNSEEEKKLADKEYQDKLAQAIRDGIIKYIEVN